MRLDQALARHDLRQHNLCGGADDHKPAAQRKADGVEVTHRQPAQCPNRWHAGKYHRDQQLADDVNRQLAHTVQPHTGGQRKQRERQQLHHGQQAHLSGRGVQQHGSSEWQRKDRYLLAEGADEDRSPQPPVDGIAQQVIAGQLEELGELGEKAVKQGDGQMNVARGQLVHRLFQSGAWLL